jgi:hypothetical protein
MKLTAELITNICLISFKYLTIDLYNKLTLVESLVEEKIIKRATSFFQSEYVNIKLLELKDEL